MTYMNGLHTRILPRFSSCVFSILSLNKKENRRMIFFKIQTLMDRRIKPWVNKKIVEYIGEDEPTLSEFICKKVIANSTPSSILADISMVSSGYFSTTF